MTKTIKIVISGPESTGKSTLAQQLSVALDCPQVKEYARDFLNVLDRPYVYDDLLAITEGQVNLEEQALAAQPRWIVCDTDVLTIKIWADFKYQKCHPSINELVASRPYDYYFLCGTDVAWEPDVLRENPNDRHVLYQNHLKELRRFHKPFTELVGPPEVRLNRALEVIQKRFLNQND